MKAKILIALLLFVPALFAQDRYVLSDSLDTQLADTDLDTAYFYFPIGALPRKLAGDTTKAARTHYTPPAVSRQSGYYYVHINRTNIAGTADSFRVAYYPVHPTRGVITTNDVTYILGSASTYADITDGNGYDITLPPCKGVAFVVTQGNLVTGDTTNVTLHLSYTQ